MSINWRQIHDTVDKKAANLLDSLEADELIEIRDFSRSKFLDLDYFSLSVEADNEVWSFTSKFQYSDGNYGHIPVMNFHPEGIGLTEIIGVTKKNNR